jgi:hypothetical protein
MQGAARRLHAIGSDKPKFGAPSTNREPNRFDAVGGSANFRPFARIPFQRALSVLDPLTGDYPSSYTSMIVVRAKRHRRNRGRK